MNQYPVWKYLLIVAVLVVGLFFALPNIYGNNPAVQVKADRFRARARTTTGDERTKLWDMMVGVYAPYTDYQVRTGREIPVVVLERIDG